MLNAEQPYWASIPYRDPFEYAMIFHKLNYFVFLDSMKFDSRLGRYSYIAIDPFSTLIYRDDRIYFNNEVVITENIFTFLDNQLRSLSLSLNPELSPFQGGAVGFFSYDLTRDLENLPNYAMDDMGYPRLAVGFYDLIISFDHVKQQAWVISSGLPEKNNQKRKHRAHLRLSWCLQKLEHVKTPKLIDKPLVMENDIRGYFTKETYMAAVEKCRHYILDGDIFEVNLSQRFQCFFHDNAEFSLYQRIRAINPAPFGSFVRFDDTVIVSSSPERFLKVQDRLVETRPIKGTIKRSCDVREDQILAQKLATDIKNRAENTMIVDLMRNDLSKVCFSNSIHVPVYCQIESYETVHHLVSVIEGKLKNHYQAIDLLRTTFPGGSISGAPKIRAMEIIEELEPTRRGPYCGSVGYIGFDGSMDTSILIRTYVIKDQIVTFQSGGAIVLDSDALSEYEEVLIKAEALKKALISKHIEK
ncbi:anthranilate synthase component I family protein [Coxiella endosymbiont of Rhipicephalus microplus]|uniref:anthranilate synthase component I family protein n=1 Tax=Coxiella endosymbiont of Rhipicephalus microplus TaxID=1656186 RepID=UPI000C7F8232|nr:anthranilate synthase component I family protein [Coxiella endosymbiont of Rhipicephalus microplus]PMB55049.1 Para-aminobenzoate synthase, aminase component [Coxiella-like endosymbiont]